MQETISFLTDSGIELCGILSGPAPCSRNPVAVLCHGFSTGKHSRTGVALEGILNEAGVAAFRFDLFGHGDSGGDIADLTISEAVDDVLSALELVRRRGYGRLGLMGSSFGGMASVLAAPASPDLRCLALKSPVSDYLGRLIADRDRKSLKEWRDHGFLTLTDDEGRSLRLNFSFYEDAETARGYESAPGIKVPTLIVHGEADETVPVMQSRRLVALLPQGELEVLAGADHRYSRKMDFDHMLRRISGFLIDHLGGREDEEYRDPVKEGWDRS